MNAKRTFIPGHPRNILVVAALAFLLAAGCESDWSVDDASELDVTSE